MLNQGDGGSKDLVQSRYYLKLAADQGQQGSQIDYGIMLNHGYGGSKDLAQARHYFQLAAASGDLEAQYEYAIMLGNGYGGDKDLVRSRHYFKEATSQGHVEAQFNYGVMLYEGEGGEKDIPLARECFQLAANKKSVKAQYNYSAMLYYGEGGYENKIHALVYIKTAADQGYSKSQKLYGDMLCYEGDKNIPLAREYYKRAVDKGDIEAKLQLAKLKKKEMEELTTQDTDELGILSIRSVHIGEEPEEDSEGADDGGGGRKETSSEEHDMETKQEEVGAEREETVEMKTDQTSYSSVYFRAREEEKRPVFSMLKRKEDPLDKIENPRAQAFVRDFFEGGNEAKALKYGDFLKTLKNLPVKVVLTNTKSGIRARVDNPLPEVQSAILTWHNPHKRSHMNFDKGGFRSSLVDFFHNLGYHKHVSR